MLSLEAFRVETLEGMHKCGDEPEATELLSHLSIAEAVLLDAQTALDAAGGKCQHAPRVYNLVEIFTAFVPLDCELQSKESVFQALCAVPIVPTAARVFAANVSNVSFRDFAEAVYGTKNLSGLWTDYMEEVVAEWDRLGDVPRLPSVSTITQIFDHSCKGGVNVGGDVILEEVLPMLHLPLDGEVMEQAFVGIRGASLGFKSFAMWVSQVCIRIVEDELKDKIAFESKEASMSS